MDQSHSTTAKRRYTHLSKEERIIIQLRLDDGWSPNKIALELRRSPNTIRSEIRRGTGTHVRGRGRPKKYKASRGQNRYEANRKRCGRRCLISSRLRFIQYFVKHFLKEGWSPDACRGEALRSGKFQKSGTVSTRTLYRYIAAGMLEIRNIDLPCKLRRRPKGHGERRNKRVLGRSIEERPASVQDREEFGHWEADLVIGSKSGGDSVLLTLLERKTRQFFLIPVIDKTAENVKVALVKFMDRFRGHKAAIFRSITTDNGSEFSRLHELETENPERRESEGIDKTSVRIYFAHPYSSYEKGSIERHNGLIRRHLRKGRRIDSCSIEWIEQIEMWCNALPRKILGYKTPEELFDAELDKIYAL